MLKDKKDYSFVSKDEMNHIVVAGKPYPTRKEKLVMLGEDEAYLREWGNQLRGMIPRMSAKASGEKIWRVKKDFAKEADEIIDLLGRSLNYDDSLIPNYNVYNYPMEGLGDVFFSQTDIDTLPEEIVLYEFENTDSKEELEVNDEIYAVRDEYAAFVSGEEEKLNELIEDKKKERDEAIHQIDSHLDSASLNAEHGHKQNVESAGEELEKKIAAIDQEYGALIKRMNDELVELNEELQKTETSAERLEISKEIEKQNCLIKQTEDSYDDAKIKAKKEYYHTVNSSAKECSLTKAKLEKDSREAKDEIQKNFIVWIESEVNNARRRVIEKFKERCTRIKKIISGSNNSGYYKAYLTVTGWDDFAEPELFCANEDYFNLRQRLTEFALRSCVYRYLNTNQYFCEFGASDAVDCYGNKIIESTKHISSFLQPGLLLRLYADYERCDAYLTKLDLWHMPMVRTPKANEGTATWGKLFIYTGRDSTTLFDRANFWGYEDGEGSQDRFFLYGNRMQTEARTENKGVYPQELRAVIELGYVNFQKTDTETEQDGFKLIRDEYHARVFMMVKFEFFDEPNEEYHKMVDEINDERDEEIKSAADALADDLTELKETYLNEIAGLEKAADEEIYNILKTVGANYARAIASVVKRYEGTESLNEELKELAVKYGIISTEATMKLNDFLREYSKDRSNVESEYFFELNPETNSSIQEIKSALKEEKQAKEKNYKETKKTIENEYGKTVAEINERYNQEIQDVYDLHRKIKEDADKARSDAYDAAENAHSMAYDAADEAFNNSMSGAKFDDKNFVFNDYYDGWVPEGYGNFEQGLRNPYKAFGWNKIFFPDEYFSGIDWVGPDLSEVAAIVSEYEIAYDKADAERSKAKDMADENHWNTLKDYIPLEETINSRIRWKATIECPCVPKYTSGSQEYHGQNINDWTEQAATWVRGVFVYHNTSHIKTGGDFSELYRDLKKG